MRKSIVIVASALIVAGLAMYVWSERAEAPTAEVATADGWGTYADKSGVAFRCPSTLGTLYIEAVDWPPQVQVSDEPYRCTQAGSETERAGETEERVIHDHAYCRTAVVEGAAGSMYTMYAYAMPHGAQTVIFTWSTRAPQC